MEAQGMVDDIQTELFGRETTLELSGEWAAYWLVILRVVVGLGFLGSGLGKLMGGLTYNADAFGYLSDASGHILVLPFNLVANIPVIMGTAVQYGEIAIGLGLILGCLLRTASFFGAVLMMLFYMGAPDAYTHGIANGDMFYLLTFITVAVFAAGRVWGIDEMIEDSVIVQNNPRLRYFLG